MVKAKNRSTFRWRNNRLFTPNIVNLEKGFGLIEILIGLVVAGILAAIAIPSYLNQVNKSRESEPVQNLSLILANQQEYYTQHGKFAKDWVELAPEIPQESEDYIYKLFNYEQGAGVTINSDNKDLKSFIGGVETGKEDSSTFIVIRCISSKPGIVLSEESLRIKNNKLGCGKKVSEIK